METRDLVATGGPPSGGRCSPAAPSAGPVDRRGSSAGGALRGVLLRGVQTHGDAMRPRPAV